MSNAMNDSTDGVTNAATTGANVGATACATADATAATANTVSNQVNHSATKDTMHDAARNDAPNPISRAGARLSPRQLRLAALALAALLGIGAVVAVAQDGKDGKASAADKKGGARPALTVNLTAPQAIQWPQLIPANGNIVAWQEAVIGPELSGSRLTDVLVNVGDVVKKGQVLARIASESVNAELAQSRAAVVESEAQLAEAKANADRARQIQATGALSAQQINQYLTQEQTALARLNAVRAKVQADELRLSYTRVVAPDDGIISARNATVGSLAQQGQELFRLIRGGRLEWRAEVVAADISRVKTGLPASLTTPSGQAVQGKVRMVAPTVDPQTRTALVYVDLPAQAMAVGARAGMFARGSFELGKTSALTLPQTAVLQREGFSYAFRVGPDGRVVQIKVDVGRRIGDRVEIASGLTPETRVIASGVGFLADGDLVRVVDAPLASAEQKK
jgi:HlyD family secretion protein